MAERAASVGVLPPRTQASKSEIRDSSSGGNPSAGVVRGRLSIFPIYLTLIITGAFSR
jgi:hypothetical protein